MHVELNIALSFSCRSNSRKLTSASEKGLIAKEIRQ